MSVPCALLQADPRTALHDILATPGAVVTEMTAIASGVTLTVTWSHPVVPRISIFVDATVPTELDLRADDGLIAHWNLQDARSYTIDVPGAPRTHVVLTLDLTPASDTLPLKSLLIAAADTVADTSGVPIIPEPLPDAATLDDASLIRSFESIGNNCELGIVQRALGSEPLDLYRFSAVPLGWILYGVDRAFAGIDASDPHEVTLEHRPDGQHYYYVWQRDYRIQYETGIRQDLKTPSTMKRESLRRMHYLAWRLMGSLSEGARIFTYRSERWLEDAELAAFADRLRRHGPAFGLIVHEADEAHPPGTMEWVAPNLLRATLRRFANPACVVETIEVAPWLALCRDAYRVAAARRAENLQKSKHEIY